MSCVPALLRSAWEEVSGRGIFIAIVFLTAVVLGLLVLSEICGMVAGAFTLVLALLAGAVSVELFEEDEFAVQLNTQEQLAEYSQRATKRRAFFMRRWRRWKGDETEEEEDDEQQQEAGVFEDEDDNRPLSAEQMAGRLHGRLETLHQLEEELTRERNVAAAAMKAAAAGSAADSAATANFTLPDGLSEVVAAESIPTSALCEEAAEAAQLLRLRPRRRGSPLDAEASKLSGTAEPENRAEHAD